MSSHGQPQKITSLPSLQSLVSQMKSSSSFSSRQNHVQSILTIKDPFLYDELINSKGIHILSKWIHDYKESVQGGGDISSEEEELIMDIIDICERCSLSINDLRDTKIGKNINKLGKLLRNETRAQKACEDIVNKWRKMIDSGNSESNRYNDNYVGKKTKRDYHNDDEYSNINSNKSNHYSNNSNNNNDNNNSSRNNLINSNNNNKNKMYVNIFIFLFIKNNNNKKHKKVLLLFYNFIYIFYIYFGCASKFLIPKHNNSLTILKSKINIYFFVTDY